MMPALMILPATNLQIDPAVAALIDACGAVLFFSAAWHKVRDLRYFEGALRAYALLPDWSVGALSRLLAFLEIAAGTGLLIAPTRLAAAVVAAALLLVYAGAIGVNLLRGRRDVDCGCGAPQERRPIGPWMIWRNLVLVAALLCTLLPWGDRPLTITDLITIAFGAVSGILIYLCVDRLAATAGRVSSGRAAGHAPP